MALRGSRPSLQQGIDKEVYQIVRKLDDQRLETGGKRLSITIVYEIIKHSNSSLKRRSKKLLEDSIDRVLRVLDDERLDDDSLDEGDYEGMEEDQPQPISTAVVLKEHNLMNRSITKAWGKPASVGGSGIMTPIEAPSAAPDSPAPHRKSNGEPKTKRRKADVVEDPSTKLPESSFEDLGGIDSVVREMERIARLITQPQLYTGPGTMATRGVLLYGPPGCGKTAIANALAAEVGKSVINISAPSLVAGTSGESEKKIRELFEKAKQMAPCLVFIDEIDVILGKRDNSGREMERRMVAQMLTCMDDLALEKTAGNPVVVVGATNRPDSLDPAIRRPGRFNKEIHMGTPDEQGREKIFRALTQKVACSPDVDFQDLAKRTPGFVGADLKEVVSVAKEEATERVWDDFKKPYLDDPDFQAINSADIRNFRAVVAAENDPVPGGEVIITVDDFLTAISKAQPSSQREGFTATPTTTWANVGALQAVRKKLEMAIIEPIKHPKRFAKVGITAPGGVLLWGPPGCGKTLLAKAVANAANATFIGVQGPELINKYVGESERAVRQVFLRAKASLPCIVFIDELDALVPRRDGSTELSEASTKVITTLLNELDGLGNRAGIYLIAATNMPDKIDSAILRGGRLGDRVFVDLPTADERVDILKTLYRTALPSTPEQELDALERIARDPRCEDFSGADLESLRTAAGRAAYERDASDELMIMDVDWEVALGSVQKSVTNIAKWRKLDRKGFN